MSLSRGQRLGPYEILAPLGAGGMGEVYRAKDSRLGREVAVKVLPAHLSSNPQAMARFEREARAVAALNHPNILAIYDFGADQGISYSVTELLEGENLRARLGRSPLPWRKAVEIGAALCEGLAAAHAKGITHRDLKPENIFLTSDGRVKILDFGLARFDPRDEATVTSAEPATEAGTVLGTAGYMSPEQVRGERADAPSDLFSLGCILYEMVAGNRAFARPSAVETMTAILNTDPPPLAASGLEAPPELSRIIARCLEKNIRQRFQSAQDLGFALQSLSSSSGPAAPVPALSKAIDSIAVLPFANAGSEDAEYLSDGITESIINSLSQLPRLRVVPRNTVFRFKGQQVDGQAVGRDLKVRAVLTGRVMQRGETLVVSAELVDTVEEAQLWGQRYTRQLVDIFAVEEEISRHIVEKLRLRLTGDEQEKLAKRYTENTEAYQLYLKGRHHFNKASEESFARAIECFAQAIEIDPGYALAHAALAETYGLLGYVTLMPPREAIPRAKAAARRALEIDEQLAEAHCALGIAALYYEWDWAEAEKEFQRAIGLNPNYAFAHQLYGCFFTQIGRFDRALLELRRAVELDPLSALAYFYLGLAFRFSGHFPEAVEAFGKSLELDPHFGWSLLNLGFVFAHEAMYDQASAAFEKACASFGERFVPARAGLGYVYAKTGRSAEARQVIQQLEELSARAYVTPYCLAWIHTALGETGQALDCLEKAYAERSEWMVWVKVDFPLDPLRSHLRFQDLLRRLAFPP